MREYEELNYSSEGLERDEDLAKKMDALRTKHLREWRNSIERSVLDYVLTYGAFPLRTEFSSDGRMRHIHRPEVEEYLKTHPQP